MTKNTWIPLSIVVIIAIIIGTAILFRRATKEMPTTLAKVTFGMLPYADHTYAIIGIKKGWFEEVGIDLDYETIKVEEIIPFLKNRTKDVVSVPPGILMASYDSAPNVQSFTFGDLFQGYALMGQPNVGLKSFSTFKGEGLSDEEAIQAVTRQLKGKTFAYPTETAIQPFIDLVMEKGELTKDDIRPLILDDPLTINAMRTNQADVQVGGVPSRIILQKEGFIPLISSVDLAKQAAPSPQSKELASILQNGWATTEEYYNQHRDIILRLASVNYRIMKFINEHPQEAAQLHMTYLSQVTGEEFTEDDAQVIYGDLDPFVTFEDQREWFHDPESPFYFKNINGSILSSYVEQGIYQEEPPQLEEIIVADDIYFELERLRDNADSLFVQVKQKGIATNEKLERAQRYYDAYDFFDAVRLANEVLADN